LTSYQGKHIVLFKRHAERANRVKTWGAKERVLVRPTKGGMGRGDGKADPHTIAALPEDGGAALSWSSRLRAERAQTYHPISLSRRHGQRRTPPRKDGVGMSQTDQQAVDVRIIELPSVRMARSGSGSLDAFDKWWSGVGAQDKSNLFPRDFMWFNPQLNSLEWLYALPEGLEDTAGYEVFDFPGGLYAVATCRDAQPDINTTNGLIHEWVAQSETFEESTEANDPHTRYDMGHVITPVNAKEMIGYHQMDLFVPIVYREPSD